MQLDQALFGYQQGHRRLASSSVLTQAEERLLVRMTDLSGSRIEAGFDSYISGYPLGRRGRYALTKTWYAPECERPGCVWTQVFVLSPHVWERTNVSNVLRAFRRPENLKRDLDWYGRAVELGALGDDSVIADVNITRMLCDAVYSSSDTVVVQSNGESNQLASLILGVLWQRPVQLREAFSFCTGALSFLKIDEQPLRVQVMPIRAAKALREKEVIVLSLDGSFLNDVGPRIELMAQDLQHRNVKYRTFLDSVAKQWTGVAERLASEVMAIFTESFLALENVVGWDGGLSQVLGVVARLPANDSRFMPLLSRFAELLTLPPAAWFYVEGILNDEFSDILLQESALAEVASSAAENDPDRALGLLRHHLYRSSRATAKGEIVAGLLKGISLEALGRHLPIEPQIQLGWARIHANSVSNPHFWLLQRSFDESAELAESLSETLSEATVLQALLHADRFDLLLMLLRAQGREGARKAFELASSLDVRSLTDRLRLNALRDEIAIHAEYVAATGSGSKLLPSQLYVLGGSHIETERLLELYPDRKSWLLVLKALEGSFDRFQVKAFQSASLRSGWWEIAELAFPSIYDRTAVGNLGYEEWSELKKFLPKVGGWDKWDKCERLRRALVNIVRRDGEDIHSLITLPSELAHALQKTSAKYT